MPKAIVGLASKTVMLMCSQSILLTSEVNTTDTIKGGLLVVSVRFQHLACLRPDAIRPLTDMFDKYCLLPVKELDCLIDVLDIGATTCFNLLEPLMLPDASVRSCLIKSAT